MKVFISHSSKDEWVAKQIYRGVAETGAKTFIDAYDLISGEHFEKRIRRELNGSIELVVLFTPWSLFHPWLYHEMGAMLSRGREVVGILYGLTFDQFKRRTHGGGMLATRLTRNLNEIELYFGELKGRVGHGR